MLREEGVVKEAAVETPQAVPRLLDIRELSDKTGIPLSTLRRLVRTSEIPSAKKIGGHWYFAEQVIADWLLDDGLEGVS